MKKSFRSIIGLILVLGLFYTFFYLPAILADPLIKEALYYEKSDNKNVNCQLCPRFCIIPQGKRGYCKVRENRNGTLYSLSFGKPVSIHVDPIEKKPLFHFLPATNAFSLATVGCNLNCKFCQNWEISQAKPEDVYFVSLEPRDLVRKVKESGTYTIAYTYTEPTVFYEYVLETAKIARQEGIKNVMHSNGYINEKPLRELAKYLDAANIDLKGFSEEYYNKICEGTLQPVLRSLKILKEEGVHLEITNLVLPGYNDNMEIIKKMCVWIKDNLGAETPLHFTRFQPMYKLIALTPTPVQTLEKARLIALDCGLKYVYIGNVPGHPGEHTYCPKCKKMLIRRSGYIVGEINLDDGKCKFCGEKIEGIWK